MAILDILTFPDPRLRNQAKPVAIVDERVRRIVDDMLETMYEAPGIGLAATQVGIAQRIVVIDVSEQKNAPLCLINPEIIAKGGAAEMEEGCLSVPGFQEPVTRAAWVRAAALDRDGAPFELEAEGLLATCIQHEIDHLDGKLFVDYISSLKRYRIRKRLEKERRLHHPAEAEPRRRAL
ncbi:peptide deformylase [Thiococcus pfennigii]|jgi:peptide deformylase|uniref:peptide deformylase n=1 Tax=Thiococcus pfennigii TaxID=1057 RepID=UPI00190820E1|nr:peptide deformylase [Thiococcus pfennigii]MBK1702663.1 peptide deformylase [Thiococcus pfennigii]MBK1731971.1 peptide deformylase [Thiococcus pfennigii]